MKTPVALPPQLLADLEDYRWLAVKEGQSGATVFRLLSDHKPTLFLKYGAGPIADSIVAEMARLRWLRHLVPVPAVRHFVCTPGEAWLLTHEVPGTTAYQQLSENAACRVEVVEALAPFLCRLHSLPVAGCPFISSIDLRLVQARLRLDAGLVDESDFDEQHKGWSAEQVWDKMMGLLPIEAHRAVTHGDFSLGNVLVMNGEVTGCIDVGLAGIADEYQDLAILWNDLAEFGSDLQQHFLRSYGISSEDRRKLEFHLCLDEFF